MGRFCESGGGTAMILITGSTGKLGRLVFEKLKSSDEPIRLLVRDRRKVPVCAGVEIVEGDYSYPTSLKRAFSGVDKAFIVSGHARQMDRAKLHRNVFTASHDSAVGYIVYTSFQGARADASFSMGRDHHQSEIYLKESGLHYTILRNSFYAETAHESYEDGLAWRTRAAEGYGLVDWDLEAWWTGVIAMGTGEAGIVSDAVEQYAGHKATSLRELYSARPDLIEHLRTLVK